MTAVTFPPSVGGDGSTVSDDANATTGLANGGHRTRFVPALSQTVAVAANTVTKAQEALASAQSAINSPGSQATSGSTLTIGTGTKTFTLDQTGKSFVVGQQVIIASTAGPTNWMAGTITAFTAGTGAMTVSSALVSGSGTLSAWTISQCGPALPVVLKAGDTMTGPLLLSGDPTVPLGAATKQFVEGAYFRSEIQQFAASGTWTKPAGVTFVLVECWGAGGGGASGNKNATSSWRIGGTGGGGGAYNSRLFKATDVPASVTVTVGLGGAGGAAVAGSTASGLSGVAGGNSSFGSLLTVYGGSGGLPSAPPSTTSERGAGGGGQLGASSGYTGGIPLLQTLTTTADHQVAGGGYGSYTNGQTSVYGGGAGGGISTSLPYWGGNSIYGGAGGAAGGGITNTNVRQTAPWSNTYATGALGLGGIGGSAGYDEAFSATNFRTLAYGDGKFLMLSEISSSLAYTSTNGITWTKTAIADQPRVFTSGGLYCLTHDGTQWLSTNLTDVYTLSNNFSSGWVKRTSFAPSSAYAVFHKSGTYVVVGASGRIYTSTDLVTWTLRTSGTTQTLRDVIHDGTYWLVVGDAGVFLRSTDAITWTLVTTATTGNWLRIASNGAGTLVALTDSTPFARRSTNSGTTWSAVATTLSSAHSYISGIVFAETVFVANTNTDVFFSSDGNTWSASSGVPNSANLYAGVAYNGTDFFIGNRDTSNTTIGYYSPTGSAFSTATGPAFSAPGGAGGNGGIAGGGGGGGSTTDGVGSSGAGGSGGNGFVRVYSW